jgi:high-affinity Fe2+/Pb2+ permease
MLDWLETTAWAQAIAQSLMLTAWLSAAHVLGFTLVTGSALVANLRLLGLSLAQRPVTEVTQPAGRGIALGLAVSVVTGVLLFSGRAARVAASDFFQLKMLLLLAAAGFHFTWLRHVSGRATARAVLRATGAVGLSLWLALAAAACAFILFE